MPTTPLAPTDLESLPDDPASLKTLIQNLYETLKDKNEAIERLRHQLYLAAKHRFGRKSEKISDDQLSLYLKEIEETLKALEGANLPESQKETITYTRKKGHGRNKPPQDLPKVRVVHPLPDEKKTCCDCHGPLYKMGEDIRTTLEHIPAVTYIQEDVLEKWACNACKRAPVTSEAPQRPIERCPAGPGFLAHIVTSKYADHMPLYRQEEILFRGGLGINRSTLCDWVGHVASLLSPLYEAMKEDVLLSKKIHTDDTPVPYLPAVEKGGEEDPGPKKAQTGRLWAYSGDKAHAHIVYDFTEDRKAGHPKAFLNGFQGYLQADAYGGYDGMFQVGSVKEVACWAHARRKFDEAKVSDKTKAHTAMAFIRKLYEVEWEADEKKLDALARCKLREEKAGPILKAFKEWLDAQALVTLPKSPLGQALTYVFNQWEALNRYLEDGDLSIDNNEAERALRCVAVGRKNWLFAGSPEGGKRAAILYSLVASCKRHKIDPFYYLRDVIRRVNTHPMSRIRELLPATYLSGPPPEAPNFQKT